METAYTNNVSSPIDTLAAFETASQAGPSAPARYAIRQALDQEYQKYVLRQNADARQARYKAGGGLGNHADAEHDKEHVVTPAEDKALRRPAPKRDFFGRIITESQQISKEGSEPGANQKNSSEKAEDRKVWVSFHEGFSNAVRKPITLEELMRGF